MSLDNQEENYNKFVDLIIGWIFKKMCCSRDILILTSVASDLESNEEQLSYSRVLIDMKV